MRFSIISSPIDIVATREIAHASRVTELITFSSFFTPPRPSARQFDRAFCSNLENGGKHGSDVCCSLFFLRNLADPRTDSTRSDKRGHLGTFEQISFNASSGSEMFGYYYARDAKVLFPVGRVISEGIAVEIAVIFVSKVPFAHHRLRVVLAKRKTQMARRNGRIMFLRVMFRNFPRTAKPHAHAAAPFPSRGAALQPAI